MTGIIQIGGSAGSFLSGIVSDGLDGRRPLTAALFAITAVPALLLFPTTQLMEANAAQTILPSGAFLRTDGRLDSVLVLGIPLGVQAMEYFARGCLFLAGMGLNGPKTLLGVCVRDMVPSAINGTVGGLLGLVGQLGSILCGVMIGFFVDHVVNGWLLLPYAYTLSLMVSIALLLWISWQQEICRDRLASEKSKKL